MADRRKKLGPGGLHTASRTVTGLSPSGQNIYWENKSLYNQARILWIFYDTQSKANPTSGLVAPAMYRLL